MPNTNKADKSARSFFAEEWNDERIKVHSQCVIEACMGMMKGTDLKKEVFIIAGWIHDLGRKIKEDGHHEPGLKFLDTFLKKYPEFGHLKEEIADCILNHRTKCIPKTVYGLIFKDADKAALENRKWLDYKRSKEMAGV